MGRMGTGCKLPLALAFVVLTSAPVAAQSAARAVAAKGGAPDLSDAAVAHVAVTANAVDVEMARLVESRSDNLEVHRFAGTMITDHTAVNGKAAALAQRLGVVPEENAVSRSLRDGAAEAQAKLEGLRGAAFDRAYMDREVAYHEAVLDALDGLLIPTTENADLRALLEAVRPAIAAHLEHARTLRASLGSGR